MSSSLRLAPGAGIRPNPTGPRQAAGWWRALVWVVGLVTASLALYSYGQWLIQFDPFARLRGVGANPLGENVVVRLEKVDVRAWLGSRQIGSTMVERIDVRQDRQFFTMTGLRDGLYTGDQGRFAFEADVATYDAVAKQLRVENGGRVWNEEMDLAVDLAVYEEREQMLSVEGKVRGRLLGGEVEVEGLRFSTRDRSWRTGPILWTGELTNIAEFGQTRPAPSRPAPNRPPPSRPGLTGPIGGPTSPALPAGPPPLPPAGEIPRNRWTIRADSSESSVDGINRYENVFATDGEIIVQAPIAELNRRTDVLVARGGVRYFSAEVNLACREVTVFRRERRAVLVGAVTMLVKPEERQTLEVVEIPPFRPVVPESIAAERPPAPEPDDEVRQADSIRRYPASVFAERIEYWYGRGNRRAEITGSPQAYQELGNGRWRRAWTHRATYDGENQTLRLISSEGRKDTRIKTSLGDDLVATWFEISTREGEGDRWRASGIEGDIAVDDDEIPDRPGRTGAPPSPTPAPNPSSPQPAPSDPGNPANPNPGPNPPPDATRTEKRTSAGFRVGFVSGAGSWTAPTRS
ncbi:MAG: hypothetical protein SNJ74_02045 [Fimbriimonadaceae bacterium]